jgi:hypothetical protein
VASNGEAFFSAIAGIVRFLILKKRFNPHGSISIGLRRMRYQSTVGEDEKERGGAKN